jgi:hypothetical protein
MARSVVIDEVHVTFRVPADLTEEEAEEVRRALDGEEFMARLRRAVRAALGELPELGAVRAALGR